MDWLFAYARPDIDWNYALVTLTVRFAGVFVVMAVMQVALQAASFGVRMLERYHRRLAVTPEPVAGDILKDEAGIDEETAVAIGLALDLELRKAPGELPVPSRAGSAWSMAGRMEQLGRAAGLPKVA